MDGGASVRYSNHDSPKPKTRNQDNIFIPSEILTLAAALGLYEDSGRPAF